MVLLIQQTQAALTNLLFWIRYEKDLTGWIIQDKEAGQV